MPELDFLDEGDNPHIAGQEYEIVLDGEPLLVHFSFKAPFVRLNDDFVSAESYCKKHIKPSLRAEFYKRLKYIYREWEV